MLEFLIRDFRRIVLVPQFLLVAAAIVLYAAAILGCNPLYRTSPGPEPAASGSQGYDPVYHQNRERARRLGVCL